MFKRVWHTLIINLIRSPRKRVNWMKKHNVFKSIGNDVSLQMRKIPLYPECIAFHNNIVVASNVLFITHDAIHNVMNRYIKEKKLNENIGCIEIMDNCFIGANTTIMPNVRIGPNAIVGAGSVVNKNIPEGEIWAGVPARRIGTFDDLLKKRLENAEKNSLKQPSNQSISTEMVDVIWQKFMESH